MHVLLWTVLALLFASLIIYLAAQRTRRLIPKIELPEGETFPGTPLQKYARWTLLIVLSLTCIAAALVAYHGPQTWWDNDTVRLTVTFVLLAALLAYLIFNRAIRSLEARSDGSFDERDVIILGRSCSGVGGAMMVVVAVWMAALTETFHETQLVPTYYLYLMFWSCVMTNVIASVAGILLAYRQD